MVEEDRVSSGTRWQGGIEDGEQGSQEGMFLTLHNCKGSPCGPSDPLGFAVPLKGTTQHGLHFVPLEVFLSPGSYRLYSRTDPVTMGHGGQWFYMSIPEPSILKSPS